MQTWRLHFAGNDQPVELAPVNGEAKLLRTAPEGLRREVIRRYGPFATSKRVGGVETVKASLEINWPIDRRLPVWTRH